VVVVNAGDLYERLAHTVFESAKRRTEARDASAMFNFLKNQHERQRKAEMDKVLWLPGTRAGERFKGEAEIAEFEEVKPVILL
jgi:hypothetical protein